MKKACFLSAIVLLSTVWLVAQTSTNSAAQSDHNMSKTTVEGCLGGSAGNYILTDQSGKEFNLRGDASKLGEHLNQEVRVTGDQPSTPKSSSTSSTSGSMSNPSIHVTNVEKVSDTCSTTRK